MKKIILTAAIALAILGIGTSTYAGTVTETEVSTAVPGVNNISEIEVHGNVQVYLTSGNEDKVTVYDNYYTMSALVQEENNVLRVTSYDNKKLVVWVTVSNLSKLSVFDHSSVNSFGKFSAIDVNVNLYDHAQARLDLDAFSASFAVNDRAGADLSGYVENATLGYSRAAHINDENLAAANLTEGLNPRPMRHYHHQELASL